MPWYILVYSESLYFIFLSNLYEFYDFLIVDGDTEV